MDHERIGKYRIVGELGRGTMGEVYKALDPVLNRHVALKILAVHVGAGDETLERFQREAQAAALLNHPNIVTIHDFGQEGGLLFMAMELLEGTDLREAIDAESLHTLDEKLEIVDGLLAALEYAHAKGVVHRDIKPANIRLGPQPDHRLPDAPRRQVKIMDFGLARVSTSEMTQEGIVLGTPNYMSPEQALGDRVDGRSDLFSAGAVLYELVTGHKPFEAETTPSVLFQVVHKEPPPVRRWAPETPPALVAVVEKALRKDRDQRFASASEMRTALAVARKSAQAPSAAPPKPPPLPPRPSAPKTPPAVASAPPVRTAAAPPLPPRAARVATPPPAPSPLASTPAAPPSPSPQASTPSAARLVAPSPPATPPSGPAAPERSLSEPDRVAAGEASVRRVRAGALPIVAGAGLVLLLLGLGAGALYLRGRTRPAPSASPSAAASQVGELTRALAAAKVQLAQRELEDKNYLAAAQEAEKALQLVAGQADASRVLNEARGRLKELDEAVATARALVDRGDTQAASQQLSRVLELDPRHPAAAELSARLNSAFQGEADAAARSMKVARGEASAAGASGRPEFTAATDKARGADALAQRGEYADATRTFLEARDGFDRARRAAHPPSAQPAAGPSRQAEASPATRTPSPYASASTASAAPSSLPLSSGTPAPAAPATALPAGRAFEADATSIATPATGGGPLGFDSDGVSARRTPEFSGRLRFEVVPATVRPGDAFVVRIHLSNEGRRTVRVRSIAVATLIDGLRRTAPVRAVERELPAQRSAVVGEFSGVWSEVETWALDTVVTSDRNETISARLRAR